MWHFQEYITHTAPPYCPCCFLILALLFLFLLSLRSVLSQEMSAHLYGDKQIGQGTLRQSSFEDMGDVRRKVTAKTLPQNKKRDTGPKHQQDSKVHHPLPQPSSSFPKDSGVLNYVLPSHSDILFTHLQRLKEEELLLDCTFTIQGNTFKAHRLILAAASQTPNLLLGSKPKSGLRVEELASCLTPVGLRAVLQFAYSGEVALDLSKEREVEDVLDACQRLRMERLREKCTSGVKTAAAAEREKSLAIIKDMWDRGIGCDITIQAETGESYPGKL